MRGARRGRGRGDEVFPCGVGSARCNSAGWGVSAGSARGSWGASRASGLCGNERVEMPPVHGMFKMGERVEESAGAQSKFNL
jgi:hypothetical protein